MLKTLSIVAAVMLLPLFLVGYELMKGREGTIEQTSGSNKAASLLPWNVSADAVGNPRVLGIQLGSDTIKQVLKHLNSGAEFALFEKQDETLSVEVYIKKIQLHGLQAKIIAVLDVPEALLGELKEKAESRKATPNNRWKYKIPIDAVNSISEVMIRELIYLPAARYEEAQRQSFFGKPDEVIQTETGIAWLYPKKSMILMWNDQAQAKKQSVFRYTLPKYFPRMREALIKSAK